MSEDTPTPPPGNVPPASLNKGEADSLVSKRIKRSFWQRIGASGLSVSLAIHVLLVFVAAAFVVSTVTDNAKKDPNSFATGAGGGSGGERVKSTERKVQPKNVKSLAKTTTRITSKSASASIALPDMPSSASASSMISGAMAGGASKGFGGGSGGGIGSGRGMGSGGGKNFVAKPVMGANIFSQRLAVYFDNSPTMIPFLDRVELEVRKQFPDADVFKYDNVQIDVQDGEIIGGEKFKGTAYLNRTVRSGTKKNAKGEIVASETNPSKLTAAGRAIFKKHDEAFKKGSLGAFLDILKDDRTYDALIVFSDFSDGENGISQSRTKAIGGEPAYKPDKGMKASPPILFSERGNQGGAFSRSVTLIASAGASGQPVVQCKDTTGLIVGMTAIGAGIPKNVKVVEIKQNVSFTLSAPLTAAASGRVVCSSGGDRRLPEEKKWEDEWVNAFAGARDNKGPRLYVISTARTYANKPGTVLQRCVSASGGAAVVVKFGDGKKGEPFIHNMTPNFAGSVRGNGTVVDFDDIYSGMPIEGKGVPKGAYILESPLYKDVKDEKGVSNRIQVRPMKISVPLTEDSQDITFAFIPLIQAVGTVAKASKTMVDVSGTFELLPGMIIQDARFPVATTVTSVTPIKASPGFFTVEMSAPATAAADNAILRFRAAPSTTGNARGAAPVR